MFALSVDFDPVATRADGIRNRCFRVELRAHLIKIGDLKFGPQPDGAYIRCHGAQDNLDQGGLAGTIGPDEPDPVTAHDAGGKVVDQHVSSEGLADAFQLRDQPTGSLTCIQRHLDIAQPLPSRGPIVAKLFKPLYPARAAGAARLHALADPDFFFPPELVKAATGERLGRKLIRLHPFVGRERARIASQGTTIQLHDAGDDLVEKPAIMGHDNASRTALEECFQLLDACNIKMVRRLIQQQQIRR